MALPEDVEIFLRRTFPADQLGDALRILSDARIHDGTVPEPRLLRCAAFASGGRFEQLTYFASLLAIDWRDVIMAGEYELRDGATVRVRDLGQPLPD